MDLLKKTEDHALSLRKNKIDKGSMTNELKEISDAEHEAWRDLCETLIDNTVTQDDLNHKVSATETPGDKIFEAIRNWGFCYAKLTYEINRFPQGQKSNGRK